MHYHARVSLLSSVVAIGFVAAPSLADEGTATASSTTALAAASPEQVVLNVSRGMAEGKPYVAWDALPASYQADVTELIHSYAARVDPDLWNAGFDLVRKAGDMLTTQKDVILALPNIRAKEGFDAEKAAEQWDLFVAPLMTLTNSDLANVKSLETMDVREFLATTGVQFMQEVSRLCAFAGSQENPFTQFAQLEAKLVSMDGDTAMVEITTPGQPVQTERFARVEGKWIPQEIATDWKTQMADAREQIAKMSPENVEAIKPRIMALMAGLGGTVDQLAQAETPQQFEQTFQMGVFQAFGGMMELSQAMEQTEAPTQEPARAAGASTDAEHD